MKNKNWILSLIVTMFILPCIMLLSACGGNITLGGNTFQYKSHSTDGYNELTTAQLSIVSSYVAEITSQDALVDYVKNTLGTLTFTNELAGIYEDDANRFEYFTIAKDGGAVANNYWGKTVQNSDSDEFITIRNNQITNFGLTLFTSDETSNSPDFVISVRNPEIAGSELKFVVAIEYNNGENANFNESITFFYQVIEQNKNVKSI